MQQPAARVFKILCEAEDCGALLEVNVPSSALTTPTGQPLPVVVRCGACLRLLEVLIPASAIPSAHTAPFSHHPSEQQHHSGTPYPPQHPPHQPQYEHYSQYGHQQYSPYSTGGHHHQGVMPPLAEHATTPLTPGSWHQVTQVGGQDLPPAGPQQAWGASGQPLPQQLPGSSPELPGAGTAASPSAAGASKPSALQQHHHLHQQHQQVRPGSSTTYHSTGTQVSHSPGAPPSSLTHSLSQQQQPGAQEHASQQQQQQHAQYGEQQGSALEHHHHQQGHNTSGGTGITAAIFDSTGASAGGGGGGGGGASIEPLHSWGAGGTTLMDLLTSDMDIDIGLAPGLPGTDSLPGADRASGNNSTQQQQQQQQLPSGVAPPVQGGCGTHQGQWGQEHHPQGGVPGGVGHHVQHYSNTGQGYSGYPAGTPAQPGSHGPQGMQQLGGSSQTQPPPGYTWQSAQQHQQLPGTGQGAAPGGKPGDGSSADAAKHAGDGTATTRGEAGGTTGSGDPGGGDDDVAGYLQQLYLTLGDLSSLVAEDEHSGGHADWAAAAVGGAGSSAAGSGMSDASPQHLHHTHQALYQQHYHQWEAGMLAGQHSMGVGGPDALGGHTYDGRYETVQAPTSQPLGSPHHPHVHSGQLQVPHGWAGGAAGGLHYHTQAGGGVLAVSTSALPPGLQPLAKSLPPGVKLAPMRATKPRKRKAPTSNPSSPGATLNPYNAFIQKEMARLRLAHPGIDHRAALKMAASAWASSRPQLRLLLPRPPPPSVPATPSSAAAAAAAVGSPSSASGSHPDGGLMSASAIAAALLGSSTSASRPLAVAAASLDGYYHQFGTAASLPSELPSGMEERVDVDVDVDVAAAAAAAAAAAVAVGAASPDEEMGLGSDQYQQQQQGGQEHARQPGEVHTGTVGALMQATPQLHHHHLTEQSPATQGGLAAASPADSTQTALVKPRASHNSAPETESANHPTCGGGSNAGGIAPASTTPRAAGASAQRPVLDLGAPPDAANPQTPPPAGAPAAQGPAGGGATEEEQRPSAGQPPHDDGNTPPPPPAPSSPTLVDYAQAAAAAVAAALSTTPSLQDVSFTPPLTLTPQGSHLSQPSSYGAAQPTTGTLACSPDGYYSSPEGALTTNRGASGTRAGQSCNSHKRARSFNSMTCIAEGRGVPGAQQHGQGRLPPLTPIDPASSPAAAAAARRPRVGWAAAALIPTVPPPSTGHQDVGRAPAVVTEWRLAACRGAAYRGYQGKEGSGGSSTSGNARGQLPPPGVVHSPYTCTIQHTQSGTAHASSMAPASTESTGVDASGDASKGAGAPHDPVPSKYNVEVETDTDSLARQAELAAAAVVAGLQATIAAGQDGFTRAPLTQQPSAASAHPMAAEHPTGMRGQMLLSDYSHTCPLDQHHALTHPSHIVIQTLSHLVSLIHDRILPPFDTATSLTRAASLPTGSVGRVGLSGVATQQAAQQEQQTDQQPSASAGHHGQQSVAQAGAGLLGKGIGVPGAVVVRRTTSLLGYAVRSRSSAVGAGVLSTIGGTRSRLAPSAHHMQHPRRRSWCPADQQRQVPRGASSVQSNSVGAGLHSRLGAGGQQVVAQVQPHTHHQHQHPPSHHLPRLVTQVSPGPLEWLRMMAASPDRSQDPAGGSLARGLSLPVAFLTPEEIAGLMPAMAPAAAAGSSGHGSAPSMGGGTAGGTASVPLSSGGAVQMAPTGSVFDSSAAAGFLKMLEDS